MKITRAEHALMRAFCKAHGLQYRNTNTYQGTVDVAEKRNVRTPSGVLIHIPRAPLKILSTTRAYIVWQGEPLTAVEEALATIKVITGRTDIFVLRTIREITTTGASSCPA